MPPSKEDHYFGIAYVSSARGDYVTYTACSYRIHTPYERFYEIKEYFDT